MEAARIDGVAGDREEPVWEEEDDEAVANQYWASAGPRWASDLRTWQQGEERGREGQAGPTWVAAGCYVFLAKPFLFLFCIFCLYFHFKFYFEYFKNTRD